MRKSPRDRGLVGIALLLMSCGGGSGQTGAAGNGGGRAGSGGASGAGGTTGGAGGTTGGGAGTTGGAGGGSASCPSVSPCGGDIVGTWKVTQSCLTATSDLSSECAGGSANLVYMIGGTVTYQADKTYSSAFSGTIAVHEHLPGGCMPFGLTCAELGKVGADAGPVLSDSCSTDATGACNCDSVMTATVTNMPGTYTTAGGTLTSVREDGTTSASSYCVQGNVLYEIPGPGDGGATATGDLVLTKQ